MQTAMFAYKWGLSSAGRALRWQRRGQEFDPPRLHQHHNKQLKLIIDLPIQILASKAKHLCHSQASYLEDRLT